MGNHGETCTDMITTFLHVVCLTGSKMGCGEGGCGACTVMLSKCTADEEVKHYAINACLTPLCAVHGTAVTTVEGIGSTTTALHPCQVTSCSCSFVYTISLQEAICFVLPVVLSVVLSRLAVSLFLYLLVFWFVLTVIPSFCVYVRAAPRY